MDEQLPTSHNKVKAVYDRPTDRRLREALSSNSLSSVYLYAQPGASLSVWLPSQNHLPVCLSTRLSDLSVFVGTLVSTLPCPTVGSTTLRRQTATCSRTSVGTRIIVRRVRGVSPKTRRSRRRAAECPSVVRSCYNRQHRISAACKYQSNVVFW